MSTSIARRGRRTAQIALVVAVAAGVLLVESCTDNGADDTTAPSTAPGAAGSAPGSTDGGATTDPTDPSTTEPTTTTTTEPPTTTTTLKLITRGAVIKVANAAGVPGAAGRFTETLGSIGYPVSDPTDAAGYEVRLDRSKVYYLPEAQKAAERLAELMGVKAFPMPTPVPIIEANYALGDATIVVMLGKDLADEPIPGLTDR